MREAMHNCQLTEVLVESNKYSLFDVGASENHIVTRIGGPTSRPNGVMSCGAKFVNRFAPDA
jgi:hypothetical protein